ncbi:MAG: hypothetical protein KAY22_05575 [Rhizorhabdus sp.]|uniref:hypothetical protein n=1 Tax=Rhizorhabdus sp. TaxID=1968843 RepID=UPI001B7AAD48|nr:hypothetical protein [Rhizorhabdus sp.]MBP8231755.1 hypothetical protein [Rhizorhabdus sp.]
MNNLKTVLHCYYFNTAKAADREAWSTLQREREAAGARMFSTHGGGGSHYLGYYPSVPVELEIGHLFNDQWNTAPIPALKADRGLRVFDFAHDACLPNRNIQRGHWLEITDEMRAVRRDTLKCGYCGAHYRGPEYPAFCTSCLDSAYLKAEDLRLLRLRPVADSRLPFEPLTAAESAMLMPRYREAQLHGSTERGRKRLAKARLDVGATYAAAIRNAEAERAGATWIMDNLPGLLENWIYYSHTGRHCFGWRKPLDGDVLSALLDRVSEFPGSYDIKCADGRTLSN